MKTSIAKMLNCSTCLAVSLVMYAPASPVQADVRGDTVAHVALSPRFYVGPVRNLRVQKLPRKCFVIRWNPPSNSRGYQYSIKARGSNTASADFRSTTFRTRRMVCGLPTNYYGISVREVDGPWTTVSYTVGNPGMPSDLK